MTITEFYIEYDALNSRNVFTSGDTINGRIIVKASKDSKILWLNLFALGDAHVRWSEGEDTVDHFEESYSISHYIIKESGDDGPAVIGKGRNIFPFSFKLPDRNMPTSFKSDCGSIEHRLMALLMLSKKSKRAVAYFKFINKPNVNITQLMKPQHQSKMKTFRFGSGSVLMNLYVEHGGYKQGQALTATLVVNNHSSRAVRPWFTLCDHMTYRADMKTKECSHILLEKKRELVKAHAMETVTHVFNIPVDLTPSTLNCSFIKLQYWLKVHLDVPFARNPGIYLPIVILPFFDERCPALTAAGLETSGSRHQREWNTQPAALPPEEPPPSYEACLTDLSAHCGGAGTTRTGATGLGGHLL